MSSCVVRERALGDFWLAGGEWDVFLVCFRLPRVVFFLALRFQLSSRFFLFGLDKLYCTGTIPVNKLLPLVHCGGVVTENSLPSAN